MIAEIRFKNLLSFRDETVFSFEADNSKDMESYHVVEPTPGVRLLKLAVVYGANASGKSNFIKICDFFKRFIIRVPLNKSEETGILPFLMDKACSKQPSEFSISFYAQNEGQIMRFVYTISLTRTHIEKESLSFYPTQQPAVIFERSMEQSVSTIKFGSKIKLSPAAKEEISLKCLPNMSVFAAYMQVNINIPQMESMLRYFSEQIMPAVTPALALNKYAESYIKEEKAKDYILRYLQEADFNISDISAKEKDAIIGGMQDTVFQHKVKDSEDREAFFEFPEGFESQGTIRAMGLAGCMQEAIESNAFLAVDEIESSLHPKLVEYIIERFLKESVQAQLLVTTHYDGLLAEEDLLRKDNVWFTEKNDDGGTVLYPLTDFKGLNRISSLQKAYKFGKFGAIPNL